jgi:DNA-binding CsgD family transcriptional regulator
MKGKELTPGVVRSLPKRHLLQIVDAAYADSPDDQLWLQGVLDAAAPILDWGLGLCAYTYTLGERPQIESFVERSESGRLRATVEEMLQQGPPALLRSAFDHNIASTLSDFLHCDLSGRPDVGPYLANHGARDTLGIVAFDPAGSGVVLSPLLPKTGSLPASARRTWMQVALHLNAGSRLRAAGRRQEEAVLDLGGKLHVARGLALDTGARAALRQAARAIDRGRSQRTASPDEALALRQAVVVGHWSLVDRFDADGRHFLVACRNPRGPAPPASLSDREHQATALAARGYSNKRIASALGLSTGSISTLLYRAARKWGAGSRTLLIQEWRRRNDAAATLQSDPSAAETGSDD